MNLKHMHFKLKQLLLFTVIAIACGLQPHLSSLDTAVNQQTLILFMIRMQMSHIEIDLLLN